MYTSNVKYIHTQLTEGEAFTPLNYSRLQIEKNHPTYKDKQKFSQDKYKFPYIPLHLGQYKFKEDIENLNINILRLLIRGDDQYFPIKLPKEILPFKDFILEQINYHRQYFPFNADCFIYLTIRTCDYQNCYYKEASNWHVDGFQGFKIPRHKIEQNFIWTNKCPTEFLLQPMFVEGLNPSKHNINDFFQNNALPTHAIKTLTEQIYVMNPYNIHRANIHEFEGNRVFIRLTFSPVLIRDASSTYNPMLSSSLQLAKEMSDVRNFLSSPYNLNESSLNGISLE